MTTNYDQWIAVGQKLGYEGPELREFVSAQQTKDREDRAAEREMAKEMAELERERQREKLEMERESQEREDRERQAQREFELKKLELTNTQNSDRSTGDRGQNNGNSNVYGKSPKLHEFKESTDSMDAFIQRFERFAIVQKWPRDSWAVNLSVLLTGKALEVYSRLSVDEALDYNCLKEAIVKRYELTEEGFRQKFQSSKPEIGETPSQFITRLSSYFTRWLELSKVGKNYDELFDHVVKEQFLFQCDKDLVAYLKEQKAQSLHELASTAERYNIAHGKTFGISKSDKGQGFHGKGAQMCQICRRKGHNEKDCWFAEKPTPKCHKCGEIGHIAPKCPQLKCHKCGEVGHIAPDCKKNVGKSCYVDLVVI